MELWLRALLCHAQRVQEVESLWEAAALALLRLGAVSTPALLLLLLLWPALIAQAAANLMIVSRGQRRISRVASSRLAVAVLTQLRSATLSLSQIGLVARSLVGLSQKTAL